MEKVIIESNGSFEYKNKIYVIVKDKKRSRKYNYIILEEFFKRIGDYDFEFLLGIRDCKILHDPLKLISVVKKSLKSGHLAGSPEKVLIKLDEIMSGLNKINMLKLKVISNIYNSLIDYSQALFIYKNIGLPSPKNTTGELKKHFVGNGLDLEIVNKVDYIIKFYKSIESGEKKHISGSKLDSLYSDLKIIKSAMGALMNG